MLSTIRSKILHFSILLIILPSIAVCQHYSLNSFVELAETEAPIENATDLAVDTEGRMYVVDQDRAVVYKFKPDGTIDTTITAGFIDGQAKNFEEPNALAVNTDHSLYVTDTDLDKLFILQDNGFDKIIGKSGKNLGELKDLGLLAVNHQGYIYVISKKQPNIVVFNPEGQYLTWIKGYTKSFEEIAAVDFDRKNNLYVLEKGGPSVHIFDTFGTYLKSYTNMSANPQVTIENAHDIEVLRNGEFFILDKDRNVITHFGAEGNVIGKFGSKGRSAKGVFQKAVAIATSPNSDSTLYVLDKEGKTVQSFNIPAPETDFTSLELPSKIQVKMAEADMPPFKFLVTRNNTMYMIPEADDKKVFKIPLPGSDIEFTLQADEAREIAVDKNNNIYVLDSGNDEVLMFDSEGVLVRKFGQEITEPLDDPTSLATLSDGSVLVVDRDNSNIKLWNKSGVFQSILLSPTNSEIIEPFVVRTDSRDFIYIWDDEKNSIFKYDRTGELVQNGILNLRGVDLPGEKGEIGGFEIDPLDQIHVFNITTNQYEIFTWQDKPDILFRYGRTGEGPHSFENYERFGLNSQTFTSYIIDQKGDKITGLQFIIEPPAPSGNFTFNVVDNKLQVSIPESDFPAVTGYGLARVDNSNNIDSIITTSAEPSFMLPEQHNKPADFPAKYAIYTTSQTAKSKLGEIFVDRFTYANIFFKNGNYKKALQQHRMALNELNGGESISEYLAEKYARLGESFANNFEMDKAVMYSRAALSFSETSEVAISAIGDIYRRYLSHLVQNKEYELLTSKAETWRTNFLHSVNRQIYASLDSVAQIMLKTNEVNAIQQTKKIYDRLLLWDDKNPSYLYNLSRANNKLYTIQKQMGAPDFELNVYLNEAYKRSAEALEIMKSDSDLTHKANLLHSHILLKRQEPQPVIELALDNLKNEASLTQNQLIAYRTNLAEAYTQSGDHDAAVIEYQKILSYDQSNIRYKNNLAEALIRKGSYEDAKGLYEQMLFEDRENAGLIAKIGEIELLQGNFAEATFQLEKAIKMNPGLMDAYPLIAQAYEGASNFEKAIEYYTIALDQKNSQLKRAQSKSVSRSTTDSLRTDIKEYNASMAHIYSQMGQYDKAIEKYKIWTDMEPASSEAWHGLGNSYMAYGRVYDALKALNTALKLNPTSQQIDSDLSKARQLRDEISKNRPPVEFIEVTTNDIFPSLYKNYENANQHPIGKVILSNNTNLPIQDARLTFFIKGIMDAPTEQNMKPLVGYSNTEINLGAIFNKSILQNTSDQTYQASLQLTYMNNGEEKTIDKTTKIKILGRNRIQWSDKRRLTAFVNPSSDLILDFVKSMDVQFRNHSTYSLNQNILKAIQAYTVLHQNDFTYSVDPETEYSLVSTNTNMLDFLQYPAETLKRKAGDCDDLVATMCSLLENSGIQTSYIDIPGHVFMAFDTGISPDEMEEAGLQKEEVIIQHNSVWIPIETTLIGTAGFNKAWEAAAERYRKESKAGHFPELISLADARNVYKPSSYTPDDFTPVLPPMESLSNEYEEQLQQVHQKTKAQIIEQLEARRANDPDNIYIRNKLGIMYAQTDELNKALRVLNEAWEIDPENATILNNMGNTEFKLNDFEKALELYVKASEIAPEDGEILVNIARTYVKLDQRKEAYVVFTKAISLNQNLADKYSHLSEQINQ